MSTVQLHKKKIAKVMVKIVEGKLSERKLKKSRQTYPRKSEVVVSEVDPKLR